MPSLEQTTYSEGEILKMTLTIKFEKESSQNEFDQIVDSSHNHSQVDKKVRLLHSSSEL